MSPEQLTGKTALTAAADVYALGCVVFEMVTGRVRQSVKPGTPARALRADTPEWLDEMIGRLTAEEVKERPWDGAEAGRAIEEWKERGRRKEAEAAAEAARQVEAVEARVKAAVEAALKAEEERRAAEAAKKVEEERRQAEARAADEAAKKAEEERRAAEARAAAEVAKKAEEDRRKQAEEEQRRPQKASLIQRFQARLAGDAQPKEQQRPRNAGLILTLAPGVMLELVRVPAGEFLMGSQGSSNEKPQHTVYLDAYAIGKTSVTVAQFASFARATGYRTTAEQAGSSYTWNGSQWEDMKGANWQHPRGPDSDLRGRDNHPANYISWDDAVAFCKWARQATGQNVQLPTRGNGRRRPAARMAAPIPGATRLPTPAGATST